MKTHTPQFKQAIKEFGREIDVKVNRGEIVLDSEVINTFKPHFNIELFKTIMKTFEFDSNVKVPVKTWVTPEFGVKVGSNYEYLNYGNYYINNEPEYSADNNSYIHRGYDSMIESMIQHDNDPLDVNYPISYKNMIMAIATKLGWTFNQTGFPNENTMIEYDLYSDLGLTYRDILDDLCPASVGNFIVTDDKELKIIYPAETGDTINEEFLKDVNVNIIKKIGPVNALTLSRAEESDTIFRRDEDSIETNELNEIKIKDNLLLSSAFRENFIDEMFDKINGFEYYSIDVASTGVAYYEPLDRFTMRIGDDSYSVVLLNSELNIEDGVIENLFSPELDEAVTDYSTSSTTDKAKKMATIIAYKNKAKIEMIAKQTDENSSKVSQMQQTVEGFNERIEDNRYYVDGSGNKQLISQRVFDLSKNIDGIDLKLQQVGGQNLFINPVGLFGSYGWKGVCKEYTDTEVKNNTFGKSALFLQNGERSQTVQVPNGEYTLSFLYKKIIQLANCKILLNGVEITLDNLTWTNGQLTFEVKSNTIEIKLISDTNDSCYVSDLMLNAGVIAQKYSSNATEVVTNNVKIGDGIEISSNAKNTIWKSDTDGTRIYDKNDLVNPKTEFTDKGTKTDEIEAKTGKISKLLFSDRPSINQTWISRL